MGNKRKMALRLDPELMKSIEDVYNERIQIGNITNFPSWSSKNTLIEYLIKVGLLQYVANRDKNKTGLVF